MLPKGRRKTKTPSGQPGQVSFSDGLFNRETEAASPPSTGPWDRLYLHKESTYIKALERALVVKVTHDHFYTIVWHLGSRKKRKSVWANDISTGKAPAPQKGVKAALNPGLTVPLSWQGTPGPPRGGLGERGLPPEAGNDITSPAGASTLGGLSAGRQSAQASPQPRSPRARPSALCFRIPRDLPKCPACVLRGLGEHSKLPWRGGMRVVRDDL